MANRQTATPAEVSLIQLRNCLVNLPSSLASLLVNSDTAAQNCVVELQYRSLDGSSLSSSRSVYLGWTGFSSKSKASLTYGRQTSREPSHSSSVGPHNLPAVEIDASFAHILNIPNGAKVGIVLHPDPVVAHTVHIEPLTPADWEIIELHATFLETNLLAQIRALPNPSFVGLNTHKSDRNEGAQHTSHPLTIHLSPTSTANILVTQIAPTVPHHVAFAKIGPDAEVIVAPKMRNQSVIRADNKSTVSGSVRSGRTSGTSRQRGHRAETKLSIFVRGIGERAAPYLLNGPQRQEKELDLTGTERTALTVWLDSDFLLNNRSLGRLEWVAVSVTTPNGLQAPLDTQQMQIIKEIEESEAGSIAQKVVARAVPCHSLPMKTFAVLSTSLCMALGYDNICGQIIRIEPAPNPVTENTMIKVYPLSSSPGHRQTEGLKFGGETRASRELAVKRFVSAVGRLGAFNILDGPLTDGMFVPVSTEQNTNGWNGGIIRLAGKSPSSEPGKSPISWIQARETELNIDVQSEIIRPEDPRKADFAETAFLTQESRALIGVEKEVNALRLHAHHSSSVLICGGQGSGKTAISKALARLLQSEDLFSITYFSCIKLVTDEIRISAVKDIFQRLFMRAAWETRLGGKSLVILDDLDKICPAEQELQVGNDNARSRQMSEIFLTIVRQFCKRNSHVILVATARGKESLHPVITGGHILPETVELKAPTKARRRDIIAALLRDNNTQPEVASSSNSSVKTEANDLVLEHRAFNDARNTIKSTSQSLVNRVDVLNIAGQTDGYMPGDLSLLFLRARSEAINRIIRNDASDRPFDLTNGDFEKALDGFTPASLRNVTLQSSSTTFSAIGGLKETRKILLETLQYPTTYAPIFAQCPLRLRSGLLLYGYPGCGKTLLASAVAGECGLNFISVKGPEILNKYIGASEKSVRDLFERAQAARPCVLFFDEFDSIAPKRGHDSTGVTDRVVNQLLTQMDGAEGLSGVYVLAATSRPDLIDPALLRPGRLDKSLLCDMPNREDRADIVRALGSRLRMDDSIISGPSESTQSLDEIARRTHGYSGADLQAVVYNAHLEAIHDILDMDSSANGVSPVDGNKIAKQNAKPNFAHMHTHADHGLVQFRYGIEEDKHASAATTISKATADRFAVLDKLDIQRQAKRRERDTRRGLALTPRWQQNGASTDDSARTEDTKVTITWKHIEKSLVSTRNSISVKERSKLEAIYNEFVLGRNGEMPSGQGPMEVGARSSLM